ncbi:hypothetical protein GGI07_001839 [Coemansia sp. Benny D115]|nr:hypothetical protein GGI07_001839 [Coemansia sp. Benny D115]
MEGAASILNEDRGESASATAPAQQFPADLPPAYSAVDPRILTPNQGNDSITVGSVMTIPASASDTQVFHSALSVDVDRPKEMRAVKGFDFSRPIVLSTNNLYRSSLIVEPDTYKNNNDTIIVIAEIKSAKVNVADKCKITCQVNQQGAYEFSVNSSWSMWSFAYIECRFVVRVPPSAKISHPGIQAELANGRVDMGHLSNISFDHIAIKTTNAAMSLSDVRGGVAQLSTTNADICIKRTVIQNALDAKTSNSSIHLIELQSRRVGIKTSNSLVNLQSVSGQAVQVETSNAKITCDQVDAAEVNLTTSNNSIKSSNVSSDILRIVTSNAKVEGVWVVKHGLDIKTSNSGIDGLVLLKDSVARANIRLVTTNSQIKVRLPAAEFRGTFDAKTSNSSVNVLWKNNLGLAQPNVNYIVDEKPYKRGIVGGPQEMRHEFSAQTSNSGIEVDFV